MKASIIVLAFIGLVSATSLKTLDVDCGCQPVAVQVCGPQSQLSARKIGAQSAQLSAAERSGAFAKLTSESAGSQTQIGAQNIVIPDKHTVTDQAKVSEAQSRGQNSANKQLVAKRTFDISGSISVLEKYNDESKGTHCSSKEGEGASQTRSRTQVCNNVCAKANIPCTCAAGASACRVC